MTETTEVIGAVSSWAEDWVVSRALCLALDGTVRYNCKSPGSFINHADEVAVYPGVEERLWEYRDRGYLIAGVANQGGVAYGHKTREMWNDEMAALAACFKHNPFHIIKVSFLCEGGTVEHFAYRSLLRKPSYGLLALVEAECFEAGIIVDWKNSLFVANGGAGQRCAKAAGIEYADASEFFGRRA